MAKIKGWKKLDESVWRTENADYPIDYQYIWVDFLNNVRIGYSYHVSDRLTIDIVKGSKVLAYFSAEKPAREFAMKYMRSHSDGE